MIEKILLYILELTGLVEITAYKNVFLFWDPKIIAEINEGGGDVSATEIPEGDFKGS